MHTFRCTSVLFFDVYKKADIPIQERKESLVYTDCTVSMVLDTLIQNFTSRS